MLSEAEKLWPGFLSHQSQTALAFQSTVDYRKNLVLSAKTGNPDSSSSIVVGYENREMGVEFGDAIAISALLCPPRKTVESIESSIGGLLRQSSYELGPEWNEVGFLRAEKWSQGTIFRMPPQWEHTKLIVKVDARLSDGNGVVTLLYEVKAAPQRNDESAFEDKSTDTNVRVYIDALLGSIKRAVQESISTNCTRLNSGRQVSRQKALEIVNAKLTSTQQQQLEGKLGQR